MCTGVFLHQTGNKQGTWNLSSHRWLVRNGNALMLGIHLVMPSLQLHTHCTYVFWWKSRQIESIRIHVSVGHRPGVRLQTAKYSCRNHMCPVVLLSIIKNKFPSERVNYLSVLSGKYNKSTVVRRGDRKVRGQKMREKKNIKICRAVC